MPADESDRLLVAEIRRGVERAWEDLINQFEGRLLAFVDSRLRNRAAAEDVVQETFLGFLRSLPNFDENTPLETFLFTIAAHKLTDLLRREGRRPTVPLFPQDSNEDRHQLPGSGRVASSMARSRERRDHEDDVLANCLLDLIQHWHDTANVERLMCMELLFVLGWTNKAAAQRLKISEQAVANHKHYVISRLKAGVSRRRAKADWAALGLDATD